MIVATVVTRAISVAVEERDGNWHSYIGWFSTVRRMRRFVSGVWQYREMTADEVKDDALDSTERGWHRIFWPAGL